MRRMRSLAVGAMALLAGLGATPDVRADLTLGVHPFKPATQIVQGFGPLASYLGRATGERVEVRVSRDYESHVAQAGQDAYDIAYLGPVSYVLLTERYGRKPLLARQSVGGQPVFHGKIIVAKNSPVRSLADLKGRTFAFGSPDSTMSHLVPRYMLHLAGIDVAQLGGYKFLGDHVNVALGVLSGDFAAGAVKEDVFYAYEARGLRAIATTPPLPDHLFVARARMSPARVEALRNALQRAVQDVRAAEILDGVTRGVTGFIPVADADYDGLREILRRLAEIGVKH